MALYGLHVFFDVYIPLIACSHYLQKRPTLTFRPSHPPLLHLPLSFPRASSTPLTTWCTVSLNLPPLLPHFTSAELNRDSDDDGDTPRVGALLAPRGRYAHASYIGVYASCRLRRIWFSQLAYGEEIPWELQMYAGA
jgi:hypothetical protein